MKKIICKLIGHSKKKYGHKVVRGTFSCNRCGEKVTVKSSVDSAKTE